MTIPTPLPLGFSVEQRLADIETIHRATAVYTALPEIEALLDLLGWPERDERLLDPGAGNGGVIVAALHRLPLDADDVAGAEVRVKGYEFHPAAVEEAREAVQVHLMDRGWSTAAARSASHSIIEWRDFLLDAVPGAWATTIVANPPYWRLAKLPPSYRDQYECAVPAHARADLLYAYLERSANVLAPGGRIGLITADRWLFNVGASELRARLGERFRIVDLHRLDALSAFYRPKARRKNTPPRVHPVSLVLSPGERGRSLGRDPFLIEEVLRGIEGVPLRDFAQVHLAPWLGPNGIFVVESAEGLPAESLVPVVDADDLTGTAPLSPPRRWAIVTDASAPDRRILAHLEATLVRMPRRGRRRTPWLPPESFSGRLPLDADAVLIPRIGKQLRPIRLPAGHLPIDHHLIVCSPIGPQRLIEILEDESVQAQAEVLAPRIDGGYRSYSATLLRQLVIPTRYLH